MKMNAFHKRTCVFLLATVGCWAATPAESAGFDFSGFANQLINQTVQHIITNRPTAKNQPQAAPTNSNNSQPPPQAQPANQTIAPTTNPALQQELIGEWVGKDPADGRIVYVTFATNGTIGLQDVQHSDQGVYSVDGIKEPYNLDVKLGDSPVDESIFEFTNSGILLQEGHGQARPKTFTNKAVALKKVNAIQGSMLEGIWTFKDKDSGQTVYWTIDKDGIFTVHADGKSKIVRYLVDTSGQPFCLDINQGSDFEEMIFEVSDSGLRIEVGDQEHTRPSTFTTKAVNFRRVIDLNSEFPSGNSAVSDPPLWGDWVGEEQGSGQILHFIFLPNGTIGFQRADGSHAGSYFVDLTQTPANLNVRWNDHSNLKAIFEITNQELHIEGGDEYTHPQNFSDDVQVLKKADPAFLTRLLGSWAGGNFMGQIRLITFAPGGVIKSAEKGQSKEGTYSVDGTTNPAYLDIKWGNDVVNEGICRLQSITNRNTNVPFNEILIIQEGNGQDRPQNFSLELRPYRKVSGDDLKKLSATLQIGQDQPQTTPQTTPMNPNER
jgi:hypothetical protein